MNAIHNLLRQTMGLHAATVGASLIDRVVRGRMQSLGLGRHEDYLTLLQQSPAEWSALVESVVIIETWFFRDREPFHTLVRLALSEWLPANPAGRLRLLSVPCSSGEEPYSMAMALLDAGLPANRFEIDAVDISALALAGARRAVYGKNSFRGHDLAFRSRHFRATEDGYVLNPAVRRQVQFFQGNLLEKIYCPQPEIYDFIFCRNLLIYFDSVTQRETLAKLRQLLTPEGVLFVGAAETPLTLDNNFISANLPLSFACRKAGPPPRRSRERQQCAPWGSAKPASPSPAAPKPVATRKLPATPGEPARASLGEARRLADEGCLAEAAEICEAYLRTEGVSAEAYYLLGRVRDAAGADSQASEFYRRAVYLEPGHYAALTQWALLSEKNGNEEHARILLARAERAKKPS